jgi:hypothetical protein
MLQVAEERDLLQRGHEDEQRRERGREAGDGTRVMSVSTRESGVRESFLTAT